MNNKISAIYFPYSRCTDLNRFKRLILHFDELSFLDPSSPAMRNSLYENEKEIPTQVREQWLKIKDEYSFAIDRNVVRLIDPQPYISDYDLYLGSSLKESIDDREFWNLCKGEETRELWSMLKVRIPKSAYEYLDGQFYPRVLMAAEKYTERFKYLYHDGEAAWRSKMYGKKKKHLNPEFAVNLPFQHGSALTIDQALLVSFKKGLIPVTDSNIHHELMGRKYEIAKSNLVKNNRLDGVVGFDPETLRRVTCTVSKFLISDEDLEKRNIEEIVNYKSETAELYERFKLHMSELSNEVSFSPWTPEFERKIRKIVKNHIEPEGRKANEAAEMIYKKMFGNIALKFTTSAVSLAAVFTPGISTMGMIAGCAGVLGSAFLPDLIDARREEVSSSKNSLMYLLQYGKF